MYSVRRAALRAATGSVRAVAVPRQQVASFAVRASMVGAAKPAATLSLGRYFSQTARVAQEGEGEVQESQVQEGQVQAEEGHPARRVDPDFPAEEQTSIYISNMTFDATEVHLREAFSQYGEIQDIRIVKDGRGLSRGFGFIRFAEKLSVHRAVEGANQSFWHGRRINVRPREAPSDRQPREVREPTTSIFVGNIPYETSDADLNAVFKKLDNVKDVRVAIDRATGWPRGFAHADFHNVEDAKKAFDILNETELGSRRLRCDYAMPRRPNNMGRRND